MIREELEDSQHGQQPSPPLTPHNRTLNIPSILLDKIQDQQFYLALTTMLLRLAKESGVSSRTLESLANAFLQSKGLDRNNMLKEKNNLNQNDQMPDESYNYFERACSVKEQVSLLTKMESELVSVRQKQTHFRALKSYTSEKQQQIAPTFPDKSQSKKDRFKRMTAKRLSRCSNDSSDFYKHGFLEILKNSFKDENECYKLMSKFIHLKTMFGHTTEEDFETYNQIFNAIFDRTQKFIITGSEEGLIKVWSRETGLLISNLKGHVQYINKIEISKCNKYLVSSAGDGIRFFCMQTMTSLGGWRSENIIDVAIVSEDGLSSFIFCDTKKLYVLDEKIMLLRKDRALKTSDFRSYIFGHLLAKNNAKINKINIIAQSNDSKYFLLGFENGEIILFRYEDLKACISNEDQEIGENYNLPYLFIIKAHRDQILQIKWNAFNSHFVTGGRDGSCFLWEFKNESQPVKLMEFQATKSLNRRKKRNFACNYVCWNCTYSHFVIGFHEIEDQQPENRGRGDITIYNMLDKKITCQFSKDISVELSAIKAMDAHPYFPNIILICESNGRIMLFDIFLKCIVNTFQERGFHILHPQFSLIPGDCRFSLDGKSFLVSTQYGSVSLYGYDIKDFYRLCPDQQFFLTDFEKCQVEPTTMRALPLILNYQQDINTYPRSSILNISGVPHQKSLKINTISYIKTVFQPKSIQNHISTFKVSQQFLEKIDFNLKETLKKEEFYGKTLEEIQTTKQTVLFYERERQNNKLNQIFKEKMRICKIMDGSNFSNHIPKRITECEETQGLIKTRRSKRGRKLKRISDHNRVNYNEDNEVENEQGEAEESYAVESEVQQENSFQEAIDEEQDEPSPRDRRRTRRIINQRHYNEYEDDNQDQVEELPSNRYGTRNAKNRKMIIRDSESEEIYKRRNSDDQEELKYSNPRKKIKENQEDSEEPRMRNYKKKQIIEKQEEQMKEMCYRCSINEITIKCYKCNYEQQFCDECKNFRGNIAQDNKFKCFICIFLSNEGEEQYQNTKEDCFREVERKDQYIPQLEDEVRYFFQGYEEFLSQNIRKLNNRVVQQNSSFRILPHTESQQLLSTPRCKVVDIKYFFPVHVETNIYNLHKRNNLNKNQNYHIQMLVGLQTFPNQSNQEIQPENQQIQQESTVFWVYYTPGSQFLLREEEYDQIKKNQTISKIILNQLVIFQNQEVQVVELSPFENKFPESLWKYVKIRKAQGKRLRGNTKEIEKRINIWKIEGELNKDKPSYETSIPLKISTKLINEIQKWLGDLNHQYQIFAQYVDLLIYPNYRQKIQLGSCLVTILDRLKNGYYRGLQSLEFDINLIKTNSQKFNGENNKVTVDAVQMTDKMLSFFKKDQNQQDHSGNKKNLEETTIKKQKRRRQLDVSIEAKSMVNSRFSNQSLDDKKELRKTVDERNLRNTTKRKYKVDSSDYEEHHIIEDEDEDAMQTSRRSTRNKAFKQESRKDFVYSKENQENKRSTRSKKLEQN